MKVLLITPAFPPYQGSHTQRMIALSDGLVSFGIDVHVLTTEVLSGHPSYNPQLLKEINPKVVVHRTPFGRLHQKAYTKYLSYTDEKYGKNELSKKNIRKKLVKIIERLKKTLLIPDSLIDWFLPAIAYAKKSHLMVKEKFDCIISCSMPNTSHLIGYKLSKKYGVPLAMDYGDPWVYLAYYGHGKIRFYIERYIENKILKKSILSSFTTLGATKLYLNKFNICEDNTVTVLTGYDQCLKLGNGIVEAKKENEKIIFTYGGALQIGIRNPEPAIKAFQDLEDIGVELNLRTDNIEQINQMLAKDCNNIHVNPYIPFDKYYEEMLLADVLVFWGNTTSDQLPGKIFNYLPSKKYILYIANNDDKEADQALAVLNDYGFYKYVHNDVYSIKEAILGICTIIRKEGLRCKISDEKIKKYSNKNQFEKYARKLKEKIEARRCMILDS